MDGEAFLVATVRIEGYLGFPMDTATIAAELQCVVASVTTIPAPK